MPFDLSSDAAADRPATNYSSAVESVAATLRSRTALKDSMVEVAVQAAAQLPEADGAGVTLSTADVVLMTAGSSEFVVDVDAAQYGLGEGPCLSAVAERRVLSTGSLGAGELRWPRFGVDAARLGVHSVASFPLIVDGDVVGSINAYAYAENAFGDDALRRGEEFAGPAARTVHRAGLIATTRLLDGQLRQATTDRSTVEAAVGVLMFRGGISADEASEHLSRIADQQVLDVIDVARVLVADTLLWTRPDGPPRS